MAEKKNQVIIMVINFSLMIDTATYNYMIICLLIFSKGFLNFILQDLK